MADPETILKAKGAALGMKQFFGIEPTLDIQRDYVRVYYPPDRLITAQRVFENKMEADPGKLRVDMKSVINPYVIKKYGPYILGLFAFGLLIGRQIK